jgi:putative transposase
MKRSRFSEEQIIAILKEAKAEPVKTVCARHNVSQGTYYQWKNKYGGMEVEEARRLRALEDENARLKRVVADQAVQIQILKVSAIGQNRPVIIEIKEVKTSHFKESKTAPRDREKIGSMEHVECPQSEPANYDIQLGPAGLVAAANCQRTGDQSRNGGPVFTAVKTGHFDHRL